MSTRHTPGYRPPPPEPVPEAEQCAGTGRPTAGRAICPRTLGACPSCAEATLLLNADGTVPPHRALTAAQREARLADSTARMEARRARRR